MRKQGIMICGHGSRSKHAEREFGLLAKGIRRRLPEIPIEFGFLEYSSPNIHMGLNALKNSGVDDIIAIQPHRAIAVEVITVGVAVSGPRYFAILARYLAILCNILWPFWGQNGPRLKPDFEEKHAAFFLSAGGVWGAFLI